MSELCLFAWSNLVKLFFFFCPFFVLNMFLSMTENASGQERRQVAWRVTLAVAITSTILYFAGNSILQLFGLELEGFRIGSGILLLIMALDLALGDSTPTTDNKPRHVMDIVVVPLALPTILGPAGVSMVIITGAENLSATPFSWAYLIAGYIGFIGATLAIGVLIFFAEGLERLLGKSMIRILSKISGIILMAMAAQMITKGFFTYMDGSVLGHKLIEVLSRY